MEKTQLEQEHVLNVEAPKKQLTKVQLFVLYFVLFSFVGWILETLFCLYTLHYFTKRGFLYGPICPIYGWGALLLIAFLGKYKENNAKLFFYSAVAFSAFEYVVSYVLEALFAMHWCDYTGEFMNLNGRISVFYFLAWGMIAILFINHLYPFVEKKLKWLLAKIPYKVQVVTVYVLLTSVVIDTIASSVRYLLR